MGFLSQVIPGLRDVRTPLAVGAMWVVTLWIIYFLIPENHLNITQAEEIVRPLGKLPVEVLMSIAILVIYIFGIFMEMISRFFRQIIFIALLLVMVAYILIMEWTASIVSFLEPILAVVILIFAGNLIVKYFKFKQGFRAGALMHALEDSARLIARPFVAYAEYIRPALRPESNSFDLVAAREAEDIFADKPQLLTDAVAKINGGVLSDAAVAVAISVERMHKLASEEQRMVIERLDRIHLLQYRLRKDENLQILARKVLLEELDVSPEARWKFAQRVFNIDPLRSNVRLRMADAATALRQENNELYQESDRLRSEGEFRRGVSIPMMVLVASLSVLFFELISVKITAPLVWIPVAVGIFVGGSIHAAGTHKIEEANSLLYSCVVKGYVSLEPRKIFGPEMFIPTETTSFTRMSEFSYEFKELKSKIGVAIIRKLSALVGDPKDKETSSEPSAHVDA